MAYAFANGAKMHNQFTSEQKMKKVLAVTIVSLLAGCGGRGDDLGGNTGAQTNPAAQSNQSTPAASTASESRAFLVKAYQDGTAEVALSRLALERASDNNVRRFAQRMIDDHSQVNNEISQLAQTKNIPLPTDMTEEQTAILQTLSGLSGAEFDRAYMDRNVLIHSRDVSEFRTQSLSGMDPDIKTFATNTLPALQVHLVAAKAINGMIDPTDFLVNAFVDGKAEVLLSTLALERSTNADVRRFAQRMIDEHTRANDEIAQLAQSKDIQLPADITVEHRAAQEDASKMTGADFDKAYMNHNVIVHESSVAQARAQSERGADPDIKALATKLLPNLIAHRDTANELYGRIEPSFLFAAFQDGLGEILLSKLALQRSSNTQVRQFAQMMINDHTRANNAILQLAQAKSITLPREIAAEHAGAYLALSQISSSEFDTAYMDRNVAVHARDVAKAREESANAPDPEIRSFAAENLPVLSAHLESAEQIRGSLNPMPQ